MSANTTDTDAQPTPPAAPAGTPAAVVVIAVLGAVVILLGSAFLAYVAWQHPRAAQPLQIAAACASIALPSLTVLIAWAARR
ncbi:hypothetical protein [Streptomyces sp. NPDC004589]|uniref:hypothetical protein n=1 Tax=Streptomyces sp. NPDC004589 TaxID=3154553 RepID=UPI0033A10074